MTKLDKVSNKEYEYRHYTDYVFKRTVQKRANGVLEFLEIPYRIHNFMLTEISSFGPELHRLDFVGEAMKNTEEICVIMECQSKLPSDDDITRFFQYVSSLRVMKNRKVELYILCTKKAPYTKREFILNDECRYTMHVISLKRFKAEKILKSIEDKIKHNHEIADREIAQLQLIAYTDYSQTALEVLLKASNLVRQLKIDENEKRAILYILDVLSANMLEKEEKNRYLEETHMNINPRDEYLINKGIENGIEKGIEKGIEIGKKDGKLEIARNLLNDGMPLEKVIKITELTKEQILNK